MAKTFNIDELAQQLQETNDEIEKVRAQKDSANKYYDTEFPDDAPLEVQQQFDDKLITAVYHYQKRLDDLMKQKEDIISQITDVLRGNSSVDKGKLKNEIPANASISKITISPLQQPINGTIAVCSATFYNTLTVNGITINEGRNGLYVRMPQKRTQQGKYIDVAHPLSVDGRRNINQTLLSAYRDNNFKQKFNVAAPTTIVAQNSVKYPPEYGNSLARLDIVVGDMVVHNAKIIKSDNEPRLIMPSYKTKDGSYTSICIPATKDAFSKMNQKALEEYNTEYSLRKLTDDDVAALKESGIKVQCRKNTQGENVVKFKFEDLPKVNAIINPTPTAAPKIQ